MSPSNTLRASAHRWCPMSYAEIALGRPTSLPRAATAMLIAAGEQPAPTQATPSGAASASASRCAAGPSISSATVSFLHTCPPSSRTLAPTTLTSSPYPPGARRPRSKPRPGGIRLRGGSPSRPGAGARRRRPTPRAAAASPAADGVARSASSGPLAASDPASGATCRCHRVGAVGSAPPPTPTSPGGRRNPALADAVESGGNFDDRSTCPGGASDRVGVPARGV